MKHWDESALELAITLDHIEGYSIPQIAERLGVSLKLVENSLRKDFQSSLSDSGDFDFKTEW